MTLGPIGAYAAAVLPSWWYPHPTDEVGVVVLAAISAVVFLALLTAATFLWTLAWAPVNLARLAELDIERLKAFANPELDVLPNFPKLFEPQEVSDTFELGGLLIVIPNTYINNRSDQPVDLDIGLDVHVEQEGGGTIGAWVPAENAKTPGLNTQLDRWGRRGGQLLSPLRVEPHHRANGYLVFLVDSQMRDAVSLQNAGQIDRMELDLVDGLTNVRLKQVVIPETIDDVIEQSNADREANSPQ